MKKEYENKSTTAIRWGVTPQRVHQLLSQGRVAGAKPVRNLAGKIIEWRIPAGAKKPAAQRTGPHKACF